jgi:hypothetical protein
MVAMATAQFAFRISDIAMIVPRVATAVSKKLVPKRTVARNFSGCSTIFATLLAAGCPLWIRCCRRSFCIPMKAVSALQKKAAHPRQRKNNITKRLLMFTLNTHPE